MSDSTSNLHVFPSESRRDVLEELLRAGAREMLATAIEAEVAEYVETHSGQVDEHGHRQIVRNGYLPERELQTPPGHIPVRQPRVRDKRSREQRERFSSKILPPYLRKTKSIEELIPWLYLK